MKQIFIIPGYGVPKDILKDLNMTLYLRGVANYIYDQTAGKGERPTVIFTGGPTDCWPSFRRTEAREMYRWMKTAIKSKDFRKHLRRWKVRLEERSISTLENVLFCWKMIKGKQVHITIFSEATRAKRWSRLIHKLNLRNATVVAMDFDASANRYRTMQVKDKERTMQKLDLWALKDKRNFRKHHQFFQKRIQYLRDAGPKNQVEAVHRFWKEGVTMLPPEIKATLEKHV